MFSLTSAAVDQSVFSVGYAPLSSTLDSAQSERLVQVFATALAARVGQPLAPQALNGDVFELESVVGGQASRLMARVLIHRGMLIQVVVSGPKSPYPKRTLLNLCARWFCDSGEHFRRLTNGSRSSGRRAMQQVVP